MFILLIFSFCSSPLLFSKSSLYDLSQVNSERKSKCSFTMFFFIHSFVCWLKWYDALSLKWWRDPVLTLWSLEYISLIYLYKHHYLFYLYKNEDLFLAITDYFPYTYFFFHCRDIIALVWSNSSFISNWTSIEICFVCKNKISRFSIQVIICKINTLLF